LILPPRVRPCLTCDGTDAESEKLHLLLTSTAGPVFWRHTRRLGSRVLQDFLVGTAGFEPAPPCSQTRRSRFRLVSPSRGSA
jgi:hypothetical protein